jgi:hypothetical protein
MSSASPAIRITTEAPIDVLDVSVVANTSFTFDDALGEVLSGTIGPGSDYPLLGDLVAAMDAVDGITAILLPPYNNDDSTSVLMTQNHQTTAPAWIELNGTKDPRPIIEQIAQAIEAKLKTVRSSLETPTQKITVDRPARLDTINARHLSIIIVQDSADENDERPHPQYEEMHTFAIHILIVPSDQDNEPVDTLINTFRADVTRALMDDAQWGGLAVDSYTRPPEYFPVIAGEYAGLVLPFVVQYRSRLHNPYEQ